MSGGIRFLAVSFLATVFSLFQNSIAQTPAFPGAEGFGKYTKGGRGGRVIEVTNLDSYGPGSLRDACEATGPRTVVFRVAGTIELEGYDIRIFNPYLTIAGQTAPGEGITLKDGGISVRANDVIIRYIRVRPGTAPLVLRDQNANGITIQSNEGVPIKNVVIDHTSLSWATDDLLYVIYGSDSVSIQWNLLSEALICDGTVPYCDGKGMLLGYGMKNVSVHHNLLAHTGIRQPLVCAGNLDYVNNISYNNDGPATEVSPFLNIGKPVFANFVGNYYENGPNSWNLDPKNKSIRLWSGGSDSYSDVSKVYVYGNIGPHRPDDNMAQTSIVWQENGGIPLANERLDYMPVSTTDAFTAYEQVLANAGVTVPARDAVDNRVLGYVRNKTGPSGWTEEGAISFPEVVGGWPTLATGTPPADSDHDGMPDFWETKSGLNPNSAADGPQDKDSDGYTNLEEYLNELAGGKATSSIGPSKSNLVGKSIASRGVKQCPLDIFGRTLGERVGSRQVFTSDIMKRKLQKAE